MASSNSTEAKLIVIASLALGPHSISTSLQFRQEQEVETPTSETIIPGGTETVLLVDDEDDIRDLGATLINNFGYKVVTANDGKEALEIYQREGESISLIILDLIMPVMDGKTMFKRGSPDRPKSKGYYSEWLFRERIG